MSALCCCWCRLLGKHCCSVSCFPSLFFPSPIFLLPLLCCSSYFCWESSFCPFLWLWPPLVNSCPLQSRLMRSLKSSGVCFYSELCHELLEWLRASPAPWVPHSWSCCLSEWVCCPSLWALLEVTREHLIASTTAISFYLFQFPAVRTCHYFLIFPAVKKKKKSICPSWDHDLFFAQSLCCSTRPLILGTSHTWSVFTYCLVKIRAGSTSTGILQTKCMTTTHNTVSSWGLTAPAV